jgi:FkbM family methyltransferase
MTISRLSPKHWAKLILRSEYRKYIWREKELERLKNAPRYTPLTTSILGKPLSLVDGKSFYYSYRELWEDNIYKFLSKKSNPFIIDGGSNIGLSIIYFKELYPNSKIIGFEADPTVYETLESNLKSFGYDNVEIYNQALWKEESSLEFAVEGADAGRVVQNNQEQSQHRAKVPAVCLSNHLSQSVDFLKLDIEGAETAVLKECADDLHQVNNLFVEYHSFWEQPQTINEILSILKDANFRVSIHSQFASRQPFVKQLLQLGMDLQLNIFAYRTSNKE